MTIELLRRPRRRPFARVAMIVPLVFVVAYGAVREGAAQTPGHQTSIAESIARRVSVFSPRSGPPGTEVRVETSNLPAITPVYLCLGGTRSGFEVLAPLMTTPGGEISETVRIPDWAGRDRSHRFIVVDVYFRPLAMSEMFYVTGTDGTLLRKGQITDEDGVCPSLRGEDGVLYALTGKAAGLEPGEQVVVEGTLASSSVCNQGTTIDVTRVLE